MKNYVIKYMFGPLRYCVRVMACSADEAVKMIRGQVYYIREVEKL